MVLEMLVLTTVTLMAFGMLTMPVPATDRSNNQILTILRTFHYPTIKLPDLSCMLSGK